MFQGRRLSRAAIVKMPCVSVPSVCIWEMDKERLHMQESLAELQTSLTAIHGAFFLFHYYILGLEIN